MKGMIEWCVRNPVAANLLMVVILVSGLLSVGLDGLMAADEEVGINFPRLGMLVFAGLVSAWFLNRIRRRSPSGQQESKTSPSFGHWIFGVSVLLMVLVWATGQSTASWSWGHPILPEGKIRKEILPEFDSQLVSIRVPYPGASPREVEDAICLRVEESLQGLEGIKKILSIAHENGGEIQVELLPEENVDRRVADIKARVDAIDEFPDLVEKPVTAEVIARHHVINVAISGELPESTLRSLAERVQEDLQSINGITEVELANVRDYEISILVSEETLQRYQLSFDEISQAVRSFSMDLPGGVLHARNRELLVRAEGQARSGSQFSDIPIRAQEDGRWIRLADVAEIRDGFAETGQSARFDGKASALVKVFRVGDQSAIEISREVRAYLARMAPSWPPGVQMTPWQDYSLYLQGRMDLMMRNGKAGLVLVFLVLALFLRFRLAFWTTLGIPVSFLGTLWLMPYLGITINMISLFAFIVVLGIVVDDAIVVAEHIHTRQHQGVPGGRGAILGTQEMAVPVIFAVMTTIAAFVPLIDVEGNTGKVMKVIPLVVIPTLAFSLIESLFILPAHLRNLGPSQHGGRGVLGLWQRMHRRFLLGVDRFTRSVYRPLLFHALRCRYLTLSIGFAMVTITLGFVMGGWIRFFFFPPVEDDNIAAMVEMPLGTPAETTARAVRQLEEGAFRVREKLAREDGNMPSPFQHFMASIGQQPFRSEQSREPGSVGRQYLGDHLGEVHIELTASEKRTRSSNALAALWREEVSVIPGATLLRFSSAVFTTGEALNIQLSGSSLEDLQLEAEELKKALAQFPGVFDISDSFRPGKPELLIRPKARAIQEGLTLREMARQVRQALHGTELQTFQRGRDEVTVQLRYPRRQREELADLNQLHLRLPNGKSLPFSMVADLEWRNGLSNITRVDRRRVIHVTADVDAQRGEPSLILEKLEETFFPGMKQRHPGISVRYEGSRREQSETIQGLIRGFIVILISVFALLAIPFRSYIQPAIVMAAIPFGLVGAVWGHVIMGLDITIISGFGIVALAGVVVNDSLVMVDYVNRTRERGVPLLLSVRKSGVARFRPILLTSLTTFAGLTPLLMEKSVQAKFLVPMAVSLGFGVLFATLITLFLVPCLYLILEDLKKTTARLFGH